MRKEAQLRVRFQGADPPKLTDTSGGSLYPGGGKTAQHKGN